MKSNDELLYFVLTLVNLDLYVKDTYALLIDYWDKQ